jgi:lysophospholipase L1-like esterase
LEIVMPRVFNIPLLRIVVLAGLACLSSHQAGHAAPNGLTGQSADGNATPAFVLQNKQRILFLGDSNTFDGKFIAYLDAYLCTRFPTKRFELINLGLPSETVSGLSEPDHPYPRPNVHDRADKALAQTKPDVVVICYGMNDGIYYPFSDDRFSKYQDGIRKLVRKVEQTGARSILMTPAPFDAGALKDKVQPKEAAKFSWLRPYQRYDEDVLTRYSDWLVSLRDKQYLVVDAHAAVLKHLAAMRKNNPAYRVSGDGIHPNANGHMVIALELLKELQAPEAVVDIAIDVNKKPPGPSWLKIGMPQPNVLSFSLPVPRPMPADPAWSVDAKELERFDSRLNRYRLKVEGLDGVLTLEADNTKSKGFKADFKGSKLATGVDVARVRQLDPRSDNDLVKLVLEKNRILGLAWLTHVGHKRPDTPMGMPLDAALKKVVGIEEEIRRLCIPTDIHVTITAQPQEQASIVRIDSGVSGHIHPALCITKKGTLVAVYCKSEYQPYLITRSTDRGRTWSKPALFPHTVKTQVYPGSLTTLADGRLLHAWNVWFPVGDKGRSRYVAYSLSDDDGLTWTEPVSLAKNQDPKVESVIRHPIVELSPTAWLLPLADRAVVYNPLTKQETPFGDGRSHGLVPIVRTGKGTLVSGKGLRSTDGGKNWQEIKPFPDVASQGWRHQLVSLPNGLLLASQILGPGVGGERINFILSRDDGRSWDLDHPVEFYNPGRAIGGRACPRTVALDGQTLATIFYDTDGNQPGGSGVFIRATRMKLDPTTKPGEHGALLIPSAMYFGITRVSAGTIPLITLVPFWADMVPFLRVHVRSLRSESGSGRGAVPAALQCRKPARNYVDFASQPR